MKGSFSVTTTTRPCARPGCTRIARRCPWATRTRSAKYCETCRSHARRHGDPQQLPIRKPEVTKIVNRIKKLLRGGNVERVEAYLRERAALLRDVVESPEAVEVQSSRFRLWVISWKQQAVTEMLKVLNDSDPVESGYLVAAMFLLRLERPGDFASDLGFNYELARLWRAQTRMSFGSYYNQEQDAVRYVHRVLPARVTEYIAEFLVATYSRFAGHVIGAVEKDRVRKQEHEKQLAEGFETL